LPSIRRKSGPSDDEVTSNKRMSPTSATLSGQWKRNRATHGGRPMQANRVRARFSGLFVGILFGSIVPLAHAQAPVERPTDFGLNGIVLLKPLSFPECPTKAVLPDMANDYPTGQSYDLDAPNPCFAHQNHQLIGSAVADTENVTVSWPKSNAPDISRNAVVSIRNGVVQSIEMHTFGTVDQDRIYGLLKSRFGRPSDEHTQAVQNRTGAKYKAIDADWKRPGGAVVVMKGLWDTAVWDTLDNGLVIAMSAQESARLNAELDAAR